MQEVYRLSEADSWAFGFRIPYLPDLLADPHNSGALLGHPILEAYGRQVSFLRAYASRAPRESALQVRFVRINERLVEPYLLGSAVRHDIAWDLALLVRHGMPSEIPLEVLSEGDLATALDPLSGRMLDGGRFAEIRRAAEPVDATLPPSLAVNEFDRVIRPWAWSPHSLTTSLQVLLGQEGPAVLGVHVEPVRVTDSYQDYLRRGAEHYLSRLREPTEAMTQAALQDARKTFLDQARSLRRGTLHCRIYVAASEPLLPGAVEFIGSDLGRTGKDLGDGYGAAFEVVHPHGPQQVSAAGRLLRCLEAEPTPSSVTDREINDLATIVDPLGAHCAFRIPMTPRGGLPGVQSARMSRLGRGVPTSPLQDARILLGSSPRVGEISLTVDDIVRHLLVSGVPGSGKTTTVQALLYRLTTELQLPFLVIDPAKRDYGELLARVRDAGFNVEYIRLDAGAPFFNLFAVPSEGNVHAHATRLVSSLDSVFRLEQNFPLGYLVLSRAVTGALEEAQHEQRHATLRDIYRSVLEEVGHDSWKGEHGQNARAALLGRLDYLTSGPLGAILASATPLPWDDLLAKPCVIELGGLGGSMDRGLVFSLVVAGLLGSRDPGASRPLSHVTVLEEAHRILHKSMSGDVGTRAFTEAIAELRGSGEGFVIVDQAPSELVSEVGKLTGSKLTHRLADAEERAAAGASMGMTPGQYAELAILPPGRLVAFTGSASEAMITEVVVPKSFDQQVTRAVAASEPEVVKSPVWCFDCPAACLGRTGGEVLGAEDLQGRPGSETLVQLHDSTTAILSGHLGRSPTVIELHCATARILASEEVTSRREMRSRIRTSAELLNQTHNQHDKSEH